MARSPLSSQIDDPMRQAGASASSANGYMAMAIMPWMPSAMLSRAWVDMGRERASVHAGSGSAMQSPINVTSADPLLAEIKVRPSAIRTMRLPPPPRVFIRYVLGRQKVNGPVLCTPDSQQKGHQ